MFLVPAVIIFYACDSGPCCACKTPLPFPAISPPLFGVSPGAVACGVSSVVCGDRVAHVCGDWAVCDHTQP
jgi:hypothetical protein